MTGFELFLDVIAICFVFLLVGRDRNAPTVIEVEPTPEAVVEEEVEKAIAVLPAGPLAGSLPICEVVGWMPSEAVAIALVEKAIKEVFAEVPPARVGGRAKARITALLARAQELREQELRVDAAIFTVATVATGRPVKRRK